MAAVRALLLARVSDALTDLSVVYFRRRYRKRRTVARRVRVARRYRKKRYLAKRLRRRVKFTGRSRRWRLVVIWILIIYVMSLVFR